VAIPISSTIRRRAPLKRWLLRLLYSRFSAVTYVGQANRDYFRAFGVRESRLHFAPHCVDASHFTPTPALRAATAALRAQLDLGDAPCRALRRQTRPRQTAPRTPRSLSSRSPLPTPRSSSSARPRKKGAPSSPPRRQTAVVRFLPFANQSEMPVRYLLGRSLRASLARPLRNLGPRGQRSHAPRRPLLSSATASVASATSSPIAKRAGSSRRRSRPRSAPLAAHSRPRSHRARRPTRGRARRISGYTYAPPTSGLLAALASLPPPRPAFMRITIVMGFFSRAPARRRRDGKNLVSPR
jgi:hypothetical protein